MSTTNVFRRALQWSFTIAMAFDLNAAAAQIRVNPTGVNVNGQGATTVFLTFGGLGSAYRPVEAFWCGELLPAAPDIGNRCDPSTLFGQLPLRYDLSQQGNGSFTDIMSIPASVARRAYDAAAGGANSSFFYVRRFVGAPGQPDQYVTVTCRMAGGGARVPLALTDVRVSFEGAPPLLVVSSGTTPPAVAAELVYNGTGRLRGRWEIIRPGDRVPEDRDLLTEATLAPEERGSQQRFEELARFNVFLPPVGRATLPGPDPARLPTTGEGSYLLLLRIEVSDDKEGDSDLGAAGAGTGVLHNGAVAGFPMPVLRYVVGERGNELSGARADGALRLLAPRADAHMNQEEPISFAWSRPAQASWYRLEVETNDGAMILAAYQDRGNASYRPPPWLAERYAGAALRWRVIAYDASGRPVGQTDWRSLRVDRRQ